MSISNLRMVNKTASSVTVAVDSDLTDDYVAVSLRTSGEWQEADKQDVIDGLGDHNAEQPAQPTNTFTFSNLSAATTYHVGVASRIQEIVVDPPATGTVPQPTSLTSPSKTSTSITLEWVGPQNTETVASGLEYDFQAAIEPVSQGGLPYYSAGQPMLYPINEGDATLMANNKDPDGWRSGYVTAERARLRASTKSIVCETYANSINDFQSRTEFHPFSESPFDKIRWKNHVTWAWGYSLWLEPNDPSNSYMVLGQGHDVIEYAPDGTRDAGVSPVFAFRVDSDTTQEPPASRDDMGVTYGSSQPLAFPTLSDPSGKSQVDYKKWTLPSNFRGRWVDIVFIVRFDPVGQSAWPNNGVAPYDSLLEIWVDGVRMTYASGNIPFGANDNQTKGHYPKFGIYSGWKLKNYASPPSADGAWLGTTQRALFSAMKMAKGANATYEMVNPSGRCTAIEIQQETSPGAWQVIKTLPPSFESYTVTGLTTATQYKYRVRCRYNDETSTPSGTITVTTS